MAVGDGRRQSPSPSRPSALIHLKVASWSAPAGTPRLRTGSQRLALAAPATPPHHPAQFSDNVQDGGAGAPGAIADGVAVQLLLDVKAQNLFVRNQTLSWAAHDGSPAREDGSRIAGSSRRRRWPRADVRRPHGVGGCAARDGV